MKDPGSTRKRKSKSKKHKKDFIKLKDIPIEVVESIAACSRKSGPEVAAPAVTANTDHSMSLDEYKQLTLSHDIETLSSNIAVEGYRHKTPIKILEELRTKCLLDYELKFRAAGSDADRPRRQLCALGSLSASGSHPTSAKLAKHSSAMAMLQTILPSISSYYSLQELVRRTPRVIVRKGKFQGVTPTPNGKVPEGPRPPCKYPAVFADDAS